MRFVSLFAGVGGFDLGFESAGMTCVGQVDIDRHALGVLARHWPEVPRHDDVRTSKEWADAIGLVGNVDLVCGGFPCQDVSVAGKRAGLAGERTGLFWDALDFAVHVKARWIVLENVAGLLSSNNGHDFPAVVGAIRNAGFHYVEWRLFDSQFYGVPQRRRRVYLVGHTRDPRRLPLFVERESGGGDSQAGFQSREAAAADAGAGVAGASWWDGGQVSQTLDAVLAKGQTMPEKNRFPAVLIPSAYTGTSFGQYAEGVGTVRAAGGDLGGGSETLVIGK